MSAGDTQVSLPAKIFPSGAQAERTFISDIVYVQKPFDIFTLCSLMANIGSIGG